MKSINTFTAVAVLAAMSVLSVDAQAGLFGRFLGRDCGASKSCDCAPTYQPSKCRPTIARPCHVNVYNYQRSCAKPMCDDACAPAGACAPVSQDCAPAADACAPGADACVPGAGAACCPTDNGCAAPCAPAGDACCPQTACEIAELIYESQTACYAKQRRRAIRKLNRRYDCVCHPEIMAAFVYALNDADERVRAEAAGAIGDQTKKYPCCCSQCVVNALTVALADCDRKVRRLAERALRMCGYDVVDGCCEVACDAGCAPGCVPGTAPAPNGSDNGEADAPAPAPPAEDGDRAYFPKRLPQQSAKPTTIRQSLKNMFSVLN